MAGQIIDLLESHGAKVLLKQLQCSSLRHKTQSEYQVWQEGSKPKQIGSDEMMLQKLEYIHNNPVKRGYVDEAVYLNAIPVLSNYAGIAGTGEGDHGLAVRGVVPWPAAVAKRSFAECVPKQEFGNEGRTATVERMRSGRRSRTRLACTICTATCGSGSRRC